MRAELDREQMILTVRGLLREHKGPGNCITMYQLYHHVTGRPIIPALKVNQTRLLRSIVAQLQRDGEPIVHTSGDAGGYYYATNSADIDKEANWHHKRALSSLRREKALKKLSIHDLLKQVEIELNQQEEVTP